MSEPATFGARLRRQREERGVSLRAIADSTKVSASYFAGLERGDCSRWPAGIYSRAFVRGYAEAIGLDPETVASDFFHCFPALAVPAARPTSTTGPAPAQASIADTRTDLRLMLADSPADRARERGARLLRVLMELGAMLALAAAVGAANGRFWMALSVALVTRLIAGAVSLAPAPPIDLLAKDVVASQAPPADAELAGVR